MIDLRFRYFGSELIAPLEALAVRQDSQMEALLTELYALPAAVLEAVKAPVNLMSHPKPPSAEELTARRLMAAVETLRVGQRETQLWLLECYRDPVANWDLTMSDLGLIYDENTVARKLTAFREQRTTLASKA